MASRSGVTSTRPDMEIRLRGIPLAASDINEITATAAILSTLHRRRTQAGSRERDLIAEQNDILKEYIARGPLHFPRPSLRS